MVHGTFHCKLTLSIGTFDILLGTQKNFSQFSLLPTLCFLTKTINGTCGMSPGVRGTDNKHGVGPALLSRAGAGDMCGTFRCSGLFVLLGGS